jgi:hypothetical protein
MNEEKKRWVITIGASVLAAAGLGVLIYFQREDIEADRKEATNLRTAIQKDREVIKTTPELVKTVIVQRETDNVVKELLSDEEDVNNLVRTLYSFAEDSEITITSLKPRRDARNKKGKQDFEQVGYTLNFEGDGFHLLSFLNKVETHGRFMSVTAFKVQAAGRNDYEEEAGPRHRVQLDLETYVYKPTGTSTPVKIDHYERKRDLLISEISKRASELRFTPYEYRGQQGRRDPWIDPRVAVDEDGPPQLSIEEQVELVAELIERTKEAQATFEEVKDAPNVIAEMKARARLEEQIALLDEEIRRVQSENLLVYVLAAKRFENQVVAIVEELRGDASTNDVGQGPSLAILQQTVETMERHISRQEYEHAIEVYEAMEPRLEQTEGDARLALVQGLKELKYLCETVIDFEAIDLDITGIAIYEKRRPVALINGQAVSEGELLGEELIVRNISANQIEFAFRGLVLGRVVNSSPTNHN